jgi:hypothetical protein
MLHWIDSLSKLTCEVNPEELHSLAEADSVELHMVVELHVAVEPDSLMVHHQKHPQIQANKNQCYSTC